MTFEELVFTVDEFRSTGFGSVLASARPKTCDHYSQVFREHAQRAEQGNDDLGRRVFGLFHHVCFLWLKPDDRSNPLSVAMQFPGRGRSVAVTDFVEAQIELLSELVVNIEEAELRARIADLIWTHQPRGHFGFAEQAVDSYLESGQSLLFSENAGWGVDRLIRALHLARSLGRNSNRFRPAVQALRDTIDRYAPAKEPPLKQLLDLLFEFSEEEPLRYAQIADAYAGFQESRGAWHLARGGYETAVRWYHAAGEDSGLANCRTRMSECWVQEAETTLKSDQGMRFGLAASHLQKAIRILQQVPRTEKRRSELHVRMLTLQAQSSDEFGEISETIDLTQAAEGACQAVEGKTLQEAIFALCMIARPPKRSYLRSYVERTIKEHAFYSFVSWQSVDEYGRVVARRGPLLSNSSDEHEQAFVAEMHQHAQMWHGATGRLVEIARVHLLLEHRPRLEDFLELVNHNPFVRPGKEIVFARGLLVGMDGDNLLALLMLVPQVEDSLRYILEQRHVPTSKLDAEGIQEVFDLNYLLSMPELKPILGEDLIFDLEGLFIDRFGENFRNRLAHGLLQDGHSWTDQTTYIWWSILRLCCIPLIKMQAEAFDAQQSGN